MAPAAGGDGLIPSLVDTDPYQRDLVSLGVAAFAARAVQFEDALVQRVEALLHGAAEQGVLPVGHLGIDLGPVLGA